MVVAVSTAFALTACGGPPDESPMPDLRCSNLEEAQDQLEELGFEVETSDHTGMNRGVWEPANWTVIEQDAEVGETTPKGTTVTIHIAKDGETNSCGSSIRADSEPTAAAPQAAVTVISLPLPHAERNAGVTLDPYDLGSNLVPGRSGESPRTVLDRANWRVVAQCDTSSGGRLTVGVVKEDEWSVVSSASVSDNTYSALLDCS